MSKKASEFIESASRGLYDLILLSTELKSNEKLLQPDHESALNPSINGKII